MSQQNQAVARTQSVSQAVEARQVAYLAFGTVDKMIELNLGMVRKYIAAPAYDRDSKQQIQISDTEAIQFMMLLQARRLDPWDGDAFAIPFWDSKAGCHRWALITAHHAFLKRAEFSTQYDGMESGVIVEVDGEYRDLVGDFVPDTLDGAKVKLSGGWAKVVRKDRSIPTYRRAKLTTFQKDFGQWVKDPAGMIVKCFDSETEVLTTRGFERFANAEGRILQVTDTGLEPTDAVPFVQPYSGPMIRFENQNLDFCVTPNHDMVTTEGVIEAADLYELSTRRRQFRIPRTVANTKPDAPVSDESIMLAAVFLADGTIHQSNRNLFRVAVSRPYKVEALDALNHCRYRYVKHTAGQQAHTAVRTITTRNDKVEFYFEFGAIADLVTQDKECIPSQILNLSMRQASLFVDTLIEFDGVIGRFTNRFYSSKPGVLRAFELASICAGYALSQRRIRTPDIGGPNTHVAISRRSHIPTSKIRACLNGPILEIVPNATTEVWCVNVPSHRIVVRRRGFSFVCGNCAEADALRSAFPSACGGLYLREEMGHTIDVTSEPAPERRPDFGQIMDANRPASAQRKPKAITEAKTAQEAPGQQPATPSQPAEQTAAPPAEPPAQAPVEPPATVPQTARQDPEGLNHSGRQGDMPPEEDLSTPPESEPPQEAAQGETPAAFVPDPKDTAPVQNVKRLCHESGLTVEQLMTWARAKKIAKEGQKLGDLAEQKLLNIGTQWQTILPIIRQTAAK